MKAREHLDLRIFSIVLFLSCLLPVPARLHNDEFNIFEKKKKSLLFSHSFYRIVFKGDFWQDLHSKMLYNFE